MGNKEEGGRTERQRQRGERNREGGGGGGGVGMLRSLVEVEKKNYKKLLWRWCERKD